MAECSKEERAVLDALAANERTDPKRGRHLFISLNFYDEVLYAKAILALAKYRASLSRSAAGSEGEAEER